MKSNVKDGIYYLDFELSKLEYDLFQDFATTLLKKGYKYLSLPSAGSWEVIEKQAVVTKEFSLGIDERQALFGSAEQGFLEYFMNKKVTKELKMFSIRNEQKLDGLVRLREFKKLEQFCFCKPENAEKCFQELLKNSTDFLEKYNIEYRIVDKTETDEGYHLKKYDIEVKTKKDLDKHKSPPIIIKNSIIF